MSQELPSLERIISVVYDPLNKSVAVIKNDFTCFEALGILEAAKAMITAHWLNDSEEEA